MFVSVLGINVSYCCCRRANEKLANKLREQSDAITQLQNDKKSLSEEVNSSAVKLRLLEATNSELKADQMKLKVS